MLSRRRFISIAAATAAFPGMGRASDLHVETGIALGAKVTLRLSHPDAPAIASRAMIEIDRLESVFSLYRPLSSLVRLNEAGVLINPPFELLDCLSTVSAVHHASGGLFDPTVQPLWRACARAVERGQRLTDAERAAALSHVGWEGVSADASQITLRPGMALTLNGIAQGFIADRVAALLASEGLTDVLIDTGELVALGGQPTGAAWPVALRQGGEVSLRARALATSEPLGMTFGNDARTSHILDPRNGLPVTANWKAVSISAPTAALADALSTAACLMIVREDIVGLCGGFPGVNLESAIAT